MKSLQFLFSRLESKITPNAGQDLLLGGPRVCVCVFECV